MKLRINRPSDAVPGTGRHTFKLLSNNSHELAQEKVRFMNKRKIRQLLGRPRIKWSLVAVVVVIVLLNTFLQIKNHGPKNQTISSGHFGVNFYMVLLSIILLYPFRHLRAPDNRSRLNLSEIESAKLIHFKEMRKQLKKTRRKSKRELSARQKEFANLNSPKGNQIAAVNQIKVYERWIETPYGSSSIIGVVATPVATTSYENLIIQNLDFSSGIVVAAGQDAKSIAKKINNAARSAERNHPIRLERLRILPSEIGALQNDTRVTQAEKLFDSADMALEERIKTSLKNRNFHFRLSVAIVCLLGSVAFAGVNFPKSFSAVSDTSITTKQSETTAPATSTSSSTQAPKPPEVFLMPNIVGLTYSEAYENISSAGRYLDYIDVLENRSVWDNENWVVVRQIPTPGTKVSKEEKICAGVTKISEKWRTPQHFGCWSEVYGDVTPRSISGDVMYLTVDFSNPSKNWHQYRATVDIDTDDGQSLKVMYCTENATAPGGKTGKMRLSGKYFVNDAVLYNDYVGSFTYSISKFESQLGHIPC